MVLKNFRTFFLNATCWGDINHNIVYEVGHYVYYKDMRGDIQDISIDGARMAFSRYLEEPGTSYPWQFLYPAIRNNKNDTAYLRQIKDYDNLEDMIKSTDFWIHGTRESYHDNFVQGTGMIILGSGDTPPTPDDYCLDSWIPTTDLKIAAYGAIRCKGYDDDIIGGLWGTYYNVTNENITVKEIGIMVGGFYYENNAYSYTKYLLAREVFENPVIIKPQEGCTFNFTIK